MENKIEEITLDTKIQEILSDTRIVPFYKRLGLTFGMKKSMSLQRLLEQNAAWAHADMIRGLKRVFEIIDMGKRFCCEIYTDEEKCADKSKEKTALYFFPARKKHAPFIYITPGGAYVSVACTVEGFPVAAALNDMGYHVFVLNYRTGIGCLEKAKEDYIRGLQYIFTNAEKFGCGYK